MINKQPFKGLPRIASIVPQKAALEEEPFGVFSEFQVCSLGLGVTS